MITKDRDHVGVMGNGVNMALINRKENIKKTFRHVCFVPIRNGCTEKNNYDDVVYYPVLANNHNQERYIKFLEEDLGISKYYDGSINGGEVAFSTDLPGRIIFACLNMIRFMDVSDNRCKQQIINNVVYLQKNYNIKNNYLLYLLAETTRQMKGIVKYQHACNGHALLVASVMEKEHIAKWCKGLDFNTKDEESYKNGGACTPCGPFLAGHMGSHWNREDKAYLPKHNGRPLDEVLTAIIGEFDEK